jgi:hypothetical protein
VRAGVCTLACIPTGDGPLYPVRQRVGLFGHPFERPSSAGWHYLSTPAGRRRRTNPESVHVMLAGH